jgi:hypothetical protein
MRRTISFIAAAGAIAFGQTLATAGPPTSHPTPMGSQSTTTTTTTTATPTSPTGNGGGYNHMNSPQHATGQPMQSCEDLIASGTGSTPGNSAANGSSAFGGSAGDVYAGSQPQNSRNTASVSQYDQACAKQPQ